FGDMKNCYAQSGRRPSMPACNTARWIAVAIMLVLGSARFSAAQTTVNIVHPPILIQAKSKSTVVGLVPAQIRHAYGFDKIQNRGAGQMIAVVDAFDHRYIEDDLAVFNMTFGLPPCATANGCF